MIQSKEQGHLYTGRHEPWSCRLTYISIISCYSSSRVTMEWMT